MYLATLEHFPIGLNRKADFWDSQIAANRRVLRPRLREAGMPGPYSEDLRERLVRAVKEGVSARGAARMFRVSESSGVKWVQRWRKLRTVKASATRGHRKSPLDEHETWLLELIVPQPDLTLEEIRALLLQQKGLAVGIGSVWRFYDRHGIAFKKKSAGRRAGSRRRSKGP
jgi:transposase